MVAFSRGPMGAFLSDLFVLKVAGGEPLRLTTGNSGGDAAWTQDGKEIVFDSPSRSFHGLWRISASGGTPQLIAASGNAWSPSISRRGNQLAYRVWNVWDTVWRLLEAEVAKRFLQQVVEQALAHRPEPDLSLTRIPSAA